MQNTKKNTDQLLKSSCSSFRGLYIAPRIEIILLDNEISLQLASNPPGGPGETNLSPAHFKKDPFNNLMA